MYIWNKGVLLSTSSLSYELQHILGLVHYATEEILDRQAEGLGSIKCYCHHVWVSGGPMELMGVCASHGIANTVVLARTHLQMKGQSSYRY